jgi:serine/threonine-protein kinase
MLTVQGLVCGTPEYMSPEQARAEPLDGRADLYSAAVILYQLTTGDIPFRADSAMGIISRHLSEPAVAPSWRRPDLNIPSAVDQVVMRGLEKNRDLRFPNAVAFREAVESLLGLATGFPTPLPASVRAAMPTARDMAGSPTPIDTAKVPAAAASSRFATTANMTGRSSPRQKVIVLTALTLVLVGSAVIAVMGGLRKREMLLAAAPGAGVPSRVPREAPVPAPPPPAPAPVVAADPAPAPEPPAAAVVPAARETHGKRRAVAMRAAPAPVAAAAASPPVAAPVEPAAPKPAATAAAAPEPAAAPAAHGVREVLAEAEKLLGQGEIADACARGEEAKRLAPKSPAAHKFLGKCYMRAGRTREANDNYKLYLELAPNAPDAPFVKSMIK